VVLWCLVVVRSILVRCLWLESSVCVMNVVLVLSVRDMGLKGLLIESVGVDLVILFCLDVGEYWFLVRL